MRASHHHHHHALYRAIHSDFWRLELSIWLHTLAWSFVSIFLPILMLNYGYSLREVIIFNIIFYGVDIPLNFLARALVLKWGAKAVTGIGTACAAAFVILFHQLAGISWPLLVALAVLLAFYDTFYWVGHIYLFIESSGHDAGRSTGILNGVRIFAGMLGPAIGAALLIFASERILLAASATVLLLSLIPLLFLRHLKDKPTKRMTLREFLGDKRERHDYLAMGLFSIHGVADDPIWPIFVFMTIGTLHSVAALAVVVSVSTILLSYVSGIMSGKRAAALVSVGCVGAAAVWIVRLAVPSNVVYYASVLVIGFFVVLISVPIDSSIVGRGRLKDPLWASTLRNASGMATPLLFFVALLPLITVFDVSFITAALSLLMLFGITAWFRRAQRSPAIMGK